MIDFSPTRYMQKLSKELERHGISHRLTEGQAGKEGRRIRIEFDEANVHRIAALSFNLRLFAPKFGGMLLVQNAPVRAIRRLAILVSGRRLDVRPSYSRKGKLEIIHVMERSKRT